MVKLYFGGDIITMDDECPVTEAILVENGKILKRGSKKELEDAGKDPERIDLRGKTMMPGLIDGHSHFSGVANALLQCDLSKCSSLEEIAFAMREYMKEHPVKEGAWVIGTNYDHNVLLEKRHPDKFFLDQISKTHPMVLVHASSHMGVTNSLGFKMLGIKDGTDDPEGGHYGRIRETGELNGYMEENAFIAFRNSMPMPDLETLMEAFQKAQEIYAGYGITTMQEGMVTKELFRLLETAQKRNIFYLDLAGYVDLENGESILTRHTEMTETYRNHLKLGGYKIFLDGSPQGRTAWMKEPYREMENIKEDGDQNGKKGYCGYPIKTDEQLYHLIEKALKHHHQLLAHCNGDAAAEQYITIFEKVKKDFPEYDTMRPVMIHAQLVTKEQLKRMKPLSMMPSFFVAHTYYWGDIHIQNFGMKRAENISPAGTAAGLEMPFTLHQDSPVLPPNLFEAVWCAVRRTTKDGIKLNQEERIDIYEALKAVTVYGSRQYFEENEKGTLSEGKRADLVILDRNPLKIPVEEIREITVLETIKDGKTVYRRQSCGS